MSPELRARRAIGIRGDDSWPYGPNINYEIIKEVTVSTLAAAVRAGCPRCAADYAMATTGIPVPRRYRGARFPDDLAIDAVGYPLCPACGKRSLYDWGSDRLLHTDGSDSTACWDALATGAPPPEWSSGSG